MFLLGVWVDFRDLRALETDPTHQALLVEDKSIHTLLQCCGRHTLAESLIHHDQARPAADLPAVTLVKILHRGFIHKKQHVTKLLNSGLETIGCRYRPIICYCLPVSA